MLTMGPIDALTTNIFWEETNTKGCSNSVLIFGGKVGVSFLLSFLPCFKMFVASYDHMKNVMPKSKLEI